MKQETGNSVSAESSASRTFLKKFIPNFLLKEHNVIVRLGPEAGRIYRNLRALDALGMRDANRRLASPSARSFVFVCFGNIMRSPMAEALMKQSVQGAGLDRKIQVVSAGLHATPEREAHPWAQAASIDFGISLSHHRAKLLTREMVDQADCIFAMDFQNKAELLARYPESREKICMLSAYAEGPAQYRAIPDPYLGDLEITRSCYRQIQTCVNNLIYTLHPQRKPN